MAPAPVSSSTTTSSGKREQLVDAALELFGRDGYRAVGIEAVLQRAGVAKMTLYKHFRSKEDLIAAALNRRAAEISAEISAKVAAASSPTERILALFDWLESWFRSPGFHGCLFLKAASEYPNPGDLPRQAAEAFKSSCRELLLELCSALPGAVPAATTQLAAQLELLIEGATVVAFLQRQPDAATTARRAAALLINASPGGSSVLSSRG
ncbi:MULTISPECIES: TetR/AcrR family transcriptional regulator [unclassified Synechococcus]|uniref:TetR/AcrR family transcriptional regulator n=1 Tax=unclassified Synechococcus TaxID=2626047 RepID=UPI000069840C|nr:MULTISPECIES: TetR/AcrR family transcriptional regulator [unclassified Synechococcus]EAQ75658.1 transcriptional regulator [Synechococcus sp. WH 5701]WFN59664.1 TetR/AcrR family transcriptional regulator [Synechococcus sp. CCFWC 502]